ncbi:uncharacterized protein LOC122320299 [Drosophila ficusphila]|uniref:uncharacterized protein LOC122320299 n=1 Tax=Drosophila ficusphila TaxID=30025 RepID=UPI001C8A8AB4|nr:uncharacterized protein LOC122320299 [Drosophila ficusphila]
MTSLDLLANQAQERTGGDASMEVTSARVVSAWQSRWSSSSKGHGCFKSYLHRFGHETDPFCTHCAGAIEDAEYVFFVCPRFEALRHELSLAIGKPFTVSDLMDTLLGSQNNWDAVSKMTVFVMKYMRRAERQRNRLQT